MLRCPGRWAGASSTLVLLLVPGCQSIIRPAEGNLSFALTAASEMTTYALIGDTPQLHDPSVIRQGSTYYVFSSDVVGQSPASYLRIRCSQGWGGTGGLWQCVCANSCMGTTEGSGRKFLWAPDISYFSGLYHVYYAGSTAGSQRSVIGLATNTTLDAGDPSYKWVDAGEVLESSPGDTYNAIDPNISIDVSGKIWMTSGSYWSGIQQTQIDPRSGGVLTNAARVSIATRPGVPDNPIEGASIVHHGNFYFLFVSVDACCDADVADDNYKEAVGRSISPDGPFVDMDGTAMMNGGGTVILEGQGVWIAPGGGTAYVDPATGESMLVFHA